MKKLSTEFRQNVGIVDDIGNVFDYVSNEKDSLKRLVWIMGLYCRYAGYGINHGGE